jgi:hypothetical protein
LVVGLFEAVRQRMSALKPWFAAEVVDQGETLAAGL